MERDRVLSEISNNSLPDLLLNFFVISPPVRHCIKVKNILNTVVYLFQLLPIPIYIIPPCALYFL